MIVTGSLVKPALENNFDCVHSLDDVSRPIRSTTLSRGNDTKILALAIVRCGVRMIQLGVDIPLFMASTVSIGFGTLSGEVGIWRYLAWKRAVPYWIKVGHAHLTWWTMFLVLASLLLPGLAVELWVKAAVVVLGFLFPLAWLAAMYVYYEKGGPTLSKILMPVMEILGFGSLWVVFIAASGIQLPLISTSTPVLQSKFEILSGIWLPNEIFLIPALVATVGILVAWMIAFLFYRVSPHKPITPAALVQTHNHLAMIAGSAVLMLMILSLLGVNHIVFEAGYLLAAASLSLLVVGMLAFVLFKGHSILWIAPTGLFYVLVVLAFLASTGILPTGPFTGGVGAFGTFPALRVSLSLALAMILITAAIGPYIGLRWDRSPDMTVTYSQPEGKPYPGPYPTEYMGTQPVGGTPRGLENAHLSPGSWLHVVVSWLLMLIVAGSIIFGSLLHMPDLAYLFAITIPMAPIFNLSGRLLAWRNVPNGIGSLYFAGHPIKGFNIIALFVVSIIALYAMAL